MRVAIVGSGIAGLTAAHRLSAQVDTTLFEADSHFGGHAHTVDVTLPTQSGMATHGVDTGFLVFNERTYPQLIALFAQLGVVSTASEMSFSVQVPGVYGSAPLEWSGSTLASVFAQRRNLASPRFLGMLRDLLRFNKLCTAMASAGDEAALRQPLKAFLDAHNFKAAFRDWYLLPMLGCIWSCPTDQMLQFPVATMIRFCHNHGLLQVANRPQWRTVAGGSRNYVQKIVQGLPDARLNCAVRRIERGTGGVRITTDAGIEHFDKLVLATHTDQALSLLESPRSAERACLGGIRYQRNHAVLHTDPKVLPRRRAAWAAWNYERAPQLRSESARVCLHYLINRLQPLPFTQPVVVSLNPLQPIAPEHVLGEYDYAHPVFDQAALLAQRGLAALQGQQHTWFCGAWAGYGFHEDGLKSGLAAAEGVLAAAAQARIKAL